MKILKTGLFVLLGCWIYSQTPVTDAKANLALELNGITLRKMTEQNERLLRLLRENNQVLDRVKEVSEEELMAKKQAPNILLVYNQMKELEVAKNKIVRNSTKLIDLIQEFKYLKEKDYSQFLTTTTNTVENSISLWLQVKELMGYSSSIIPAKERQQTLESAKEQFEENAKSIEEIALYLSSINKQRGLKNELFGF